MEYRWVEDVSPAEYDALLAAGWRRFGSTLLRPVCVGCRECVPIRVPVAEFKPSRNQRRTIARNADVVVAMGPPTFSGEHADLYLAYHAERHGSRGWPEPKFNLEEYIHSFVVNAAPTHELQYRVDDRLIAVAYVGESASAFNSIYAYMDPTLQRRSLGTFNILRQIFLAREREKTHLYLGFWVEPCQSMTYKAKFRPHELFDGEHWQSVDDQSTNATVSRRR